MFLSIILLAITMLADAILGLVVWQQASRKKANIIFALLTLSFIVWSLSGFYCQTATGPGSWLDKMAGVPFIAGIFMAYFIALFSLYFPESSPNSLRTRHIVSVLLNVIAAPLLLIFVFATGLMIAETTSSPTHGNNIVPGPLYPLFLLFFLGWIIFALVNLVRKFRRSRDRVVRLQLSYLFIGFFTMTFVTVLTNVILPVMANNPEPARFGFLSTLFILGFTGYAIVEHRLFNIRPLIARSVSYLLLFTSFIALYFFVVLAVISSFLRFEISIAQAVALVGLALILAATFHPMRRFFEKITDRVFYRYRYDSQVVLNNVGTILASELLLENLLDKSLREICGDMRIAGGQFVIFDKDRIYKEVHYGTPPRKPLNNHEAAQLHSGILVTDELEGGARKTLLEDHGIRASLMLQTKGQIVGYLFLSDKLSGEVYSKQDITVLEILRKELAVAIVNAKAYEEIQEFNMTLQERVRQATQRLRTANANLRVLDKAKDDFISMASHQMGTPLTAITGYLSMTLDNDKKNMTDDQREFVTYALEAAERMTAMSLDLLNVSRLNSGRFIIQREPVNLDQIVRQEIQQLQPAAERKHLEIRYTPPQPALPLIAIDLSKTRQVIMNFIDNAIYYTPHGSIHVELRQDNGTVVFTVTDTGIGVPADELGRLFAKFYRAANARAARPDGTGLGLYLAKQVIEDQGGHIIFQSIEGQGSTFGFRLPLVRG